MRAGQEITAGNPQTAFEQFRLAAGKGPRAGESFAAIVAGKNDDGVFGQAVGAQGFEDAANLQVHFLDHAPVSLLRAAIKVRQATPGRAEPVRLGFIPGRLPRPMRRVEMQAQQKRAAGFRIAIDNVHGAAAQQVGEIAHLMDGHVVVPQIILVLIGVGVVIHRSATQPVEVIVSALQRAVLRELTQMPLTNQRGAVADLL